MSTVRNSRLGGLSLSRCLHAVCERVASFSRLVNTVRFLRACQITAQLRRRLPKWQRLGTYLRTDFPGVSWDADNRFLAPGIQQNGPEDAANGRFRFLNRIEDVGFPPALDGTDLPKLWQYNLQYYEWLWCLDYTAAKQAASDWIVRYPFSVSSTGWEPYPLSLRVTNWCAVFFGKFRKQTISDGGFCQKLWQSVCSQCEYLRLNLERHLLGNHYLENGVALAFVGSCFKGPTSEGWLNVGCKVLEEQIKEQILPDGIHFELSPMYHCRVMYGFAMLAATNDAKLRALVTEPLIRMLKAQDKTLHPDGRIALLNDSAFGIYNEPCELRKYCSTVLAHEQGTVAAEEGCFSLPDAGYYGWRNLKGHYLICDFGQIGPDYIPGHAHADMLGYELSLNGQRVIVDSGVFDYEQSDMRRFCRSTCAHNTVEIDGQDQCELWGVFRVALRGKPRNTKWRPSEGGFELSGSHDGYERLKGRPKHARKIQWVESKATLNVHDQVFARRRVQAVSRIHLHPDCSIVKQMDDMIHIDYPAGTFTVCVQCSGQVVIGEGWYCPEFGKRVRNTVVEIKAEGSEIDLEYEVRNLA